MYRWISIEENGQSKAVTILESLYEKIVTAELKDIGYYLLDPRPHVRLIATTCYNKIKRNHLS